MSKLSKGKRIVFFLFFVLGVWFCHGLLAKDWFVRNYGISLSVGIPYVVWLGGVFLLYLGWNYIKAPKWHLGLILVGGLVNWLDRINYGYVRDYWRVWPTGIYNNLPDWLIFIGLLGYGYYLSRSKDSSFK